MPDKQVATWYGRPVTELTREELLEVIEHLGKEISKLRTETERMSPHVNWKGYLLAGGSNA